MASITGWLRLEPLPRTTDLEIALEARVADPLWLLARQWQVGEFAGEDAGSPVTAQLQADVGSISRFLPGPPNGVDDATRAVDYHDDQTPLEVLVEREAVRSPGRNGRLSVEGGLHFARLLAANGASDALDAYLARYPYDPGPDEDHDPRRGTTGRLHAGRAVDGSALHADLAAFRADADALASLPADPPVTVTPQLLTAVNSWMDWWEALVDEPSGDTAWRADRLEYGFAVSAALPIPDPGDGSYPTELAMVADEYRDGRLDWYSFRASTEPQLGPPAQARPHRTVTRTVIPTPVSYAGQPANRFWGFEDARVSFGQLRSAAGDVGRFLLAEFALLYGDDWWIVPIDLDVGSVAVIKSLTVTDTFGVETVVPRSVEVDGRWRMFTVAEGEGDYVDSVFLLPPSLVAPLDGEPVEEVAFFRDEMANMVWGVERRVLGSSGHPVDRYAEQQQAPGPVGPGSLDGGVEDAEIMYRIAGNVPTNWIPFVPVPAEGSTGPSTIRLAQRSMVHYGPDGPELIDPRGEVMAADSPLVLEEEEVPRAGAIVTRSFQMTRWSDGSRHLWMGRRVGAGRGEGSSGLRFDYTEPVL